MPIDIKLSALTPEKTFTRDASRALQAVLTQHKDKSVYSSSYSIKLDNKIDVVKLGGTLYSCYTAIPEFGWQKKQYLIVEPKPFAHGVFGEVSKSTGIIKEKNGELQYHKPSHPPVIKKSKITSIDAKLASSSFFKEAHKESRLQSQRIKYTHTKHAMLNDTKLNQSCSVVISREFSGGGLTAYLFKMTPLERLSAALSMVKKYITQVEDNRIIHYDIKPDNFIYEKAKDRGNYIDFGLSTKSENAAVTECGSTLYQAFEIFKGLPTSKKTDYFSLMRSLQEIFCDYAVYEVNHSNFNVGTYAEAMNTLYDALEANTPLDTEMQSIQLQAIKNYHEMNFLFKAHDLSDSNPSEENADLKPCANESLIMRLKKKIELNERRAEAEAIVTGSTTLAQALPAQDKEAIKHAMQQLVKHRIDKRADSLDELMKALMLSKLKLEYQLPTNKESLTDDEKKAQGAFLTSLTQYAMKTLEVFDKLRFHSFSAPDKMRFEIVAGIHALPDEMNALAIYTDFLELDNIPSFNNKAELCNNVNAVFDSYAAMHKRLIDSLRLVSYLMSERRLQCGTHSNELEKIFFDIYTQLSRCRRVACTFNEIAELASSWQKKVERITNAIESYQHYNPPKLEKLNEASSVAHLHFTDNARNLLRKGLKFLRSQHDEGVAKVLDQYKQYQALLMQNCFSPFDDASKHFINNLLPLLNISAFLQPLLNKFKHKAHESHQLVLNLRNFICTTIAMDVASPLTEKQMADLERLVSVLQNVTNDHESRTVIQPFMQDLSPPLHDYVANSLFRLATAKMPLKRTAEMARFDNTPKHADNYAKI